MTLHKPEREIFKKCSPNPAEAYSVHLGEKLNEAELKTEHSFCF